MFEGYTLPVPTFKGSVYADCHKISRDCTRSRSIRTHRQLYDISSVKIAEMFHMRATADRDVGTRTNGTIAPLQNAIRTFVV